MSERSAENAQTEGEEQQISLGDFEESLGLLLRVAQLSVHEKLFSQIHVIEGSLKVGEFTILQAIGENPGVRQGVLARLFHIKWSSMSKLVQSLEQNGLLERVFPPDDRRSVGLVLTDAGRERVEGQVGLMWDATHDIFSMLDGDEKQDLKKLLRKVAGWPLPAS